MGSLAPHEGPQNQQWITDLRTNCIAADPNYTPDDSISWQGRCEANGMIYGRGTLTFLYKGQIVETITGSFMDGLLQPGNVVTTWSDGTKYEGGQLGGLFDGAGKFVSPKGESLDGEWKMGVLNGRASVVWSNGDRYDGEWKNGKSDGHGVETWADGRRYEGEWRDGAPVGSLQADEQRASAATTAVLPPGAAAIVPRESGAASALPAAQSSLQPLHVAVPAPPGSPAVPSAPAQPASAEANTNDVPNPALPLRTHLGSELVAVDGATLELALTEGGFMRTLVLPNGNSQEIDFAFANGPVGTVSDGDTAIGVFRANAGELDIDYADGTTESIGEATGGLIERAHTADGRAMCTAWYPQGHVFSPSEKQAAVQEYATRLGVSLTASSGKHKSHEVVPPCGGAFIASGSQQKTTADDAPKPTAETRVPDQRRQSIGNPAQPTSPPESGVVAVRTSPVHVIDGPDAAPAHLEQASFATVMPMRATGGVNAAAGMPAGASDCLTVTSNGEYWGFQNRCAKSVQFAYCEMSDANPLTSCNHTSVAGSVAANGFSALVSDRSLTEKNADHEFRWMACDGGAGEVVPHLDKIDPPSGRCERAVPPGE